MAHGNEEQQAKPVREPCTEKDGEARTPALPHEQSTKERDAPSDQTGQRRLKEHAIKTVRREACHVNGKGGSEERKNE